MGVFDNPTRRMVVRDIPHSGRFPGTTAHATAIQNKIWVFGGENGLQVLNEVWIPGRRVRLERMCQSRAERYDCPSEVLTGVSFYGVSRCDSSLVHTLIHFLTYQTGKYGPGSNSPTRYIIAYRPGGITGYQRTLRHTPCHLCSVMLIDSRTTSTSNIQVYVHDEYEDPGEL